MPIWTLKLRQNCLAVRDAAHRLLVDPRFAPVRVARKLLRRDAPVRHLLVDVYTTLDEIVVQASVPGVKPEDIVINLNEQVLTIAGASAPLVEHVAYVLQERSHMRFERHLTLNVPVDVANVRASVDQGVLRVVLPVVHSVQRRDVVPVKPPSGL